MGEIRGAKRNSYGRTGKNRKERGCRRESGHLKKEVHSGRIDSKISQGKKRT